MPAVVSADVESAVLLWLAAQLDPIRCVTELPSTLETSVPLVEVGRIGGADRVPGLDHARIDVTCFAGTKNGLRAEARALAYRVHDLLRFSLTGSPVAGGFVSRVVTESGPSWLPYDNPAVRRFGATYEITVHTQH
jgi:hypothetical protein